MLSIQRHTEILAILARESVATVRALAPSRLLRIASSDLDSLYRFEVKSYALIVLNQDSMERHAPEVEVMAPGWPDQHHRGRRPQERAGEVARGGEALQAFAVVHHDEGPALAVLGTARPPSRL